MEKMDLIKKSVNDYSNQRVILEKYKCLICNIDIQAKIYLAHIQDHISKVEKKINQEKQCLVSATRTNEDNGENLSENIKTEVIINSENTNLCQSDSIQDDILDRKSELTKSSKNNEEPKEDNEIQISTEKVKTKAKKRGTQRKKCHF